MNLAWVKDRIRPFGHKNRDVAAALGINESAVSRLVSGTRQIKAPEIPRLAAFLGMTVEEFLQKSRASVPPRQESQRHRKLHSRKDTSPGIIMRQFAHESNGVENDSTRELVAFAGEVAEFTPISQVTTLKETGGGVVDDGKMIPFRQSLILLELKANPTSLRYSRMRGRAMEPLLLHGDEYLVDIDDTTLTPGSLFLVEDRNGIVPAIVDDVTKAGGGESIQCSFANRAFTARRYRRVERPPGPEEARILGRLVWFGRAL